MGSVLCRVAQGSDPRYPWEKRSEHFHPTVVDATHSTEDTES